MTLQFRDISNEQYREYVFPNGGVVKIEGLELNVSASGGHRIKGADGFSHYVPSGWIHLRWLPKAGAEHFQF